MLLKAIGLRVLCLHSSVDGSWHSAALPIYCFSEVSSPFRPTEGTRKGIREQTAGTFPICVWLLAWDSRYLMNQQSRIHPAASTLPLSQHNISQTLHVCHICLHWGGIYSIHGVYGYTWTRLHRCFLVATGAQKQCFPKQPVGGSWYISIYIYTHTRAITCTY